MSKFAERKALSAKIVVQESHIEETLTALDKARRDYFQLANKSAGFAGNEELAAEADDGKRQVDDLNKALAAQRSELAGDQKRLSAFVVKLKPGDLAETRNAIRSKQDIIDKLQALIAEQHQVIEQNLDIGTVLQALKNQRSDLLAAVAMGQSDAKKLAAIDAELIQTGQLAKEAQSAIQTANDTITGLQNLLDAAMTEAAELQEELALMTDELLTQGAVKEVEHYKKIIKEVGLSLARIAAFDHLIGKTGIKADSGATQSSHWAQVPTFDQVIHYTADDASLAEILGKLEA